MGIIEPDNSALMVRHPDTKAVPVGGALTIHTKIVEVLAKALSMMKTCSTLDYVLSHLLLDGELVIQIQSLRMSTRSIIVAVSTLVSL